MYSNALVLPATKSRSGNSSAFSLIEKFRTQEVNGGEKTAFGYGLKNNDAVYIYFQDDPCPCETKFLRINSKLDLDERIGRGQLKERWECHALKPGSTIYSLTRYNRYRVGSKNGKFFALKVFSPFQKTLLDGNFKKYTILSKERDNKAQLRYVICSYEEIFCLSNREPVFKFFSQKCIV